MEKDFQTSFIPKQPIAKERTTQAESIGLFAVVAIFVVFTILIATGGLYFYRGVLMTKMTTMENNLNLAKNRFEPSKIVQLQTLNKRLKEATEILSKHITIYPIFQALQNLTMKTVRFTRFNYSLEADRNAKIDVKMSGLATGYRSVALQSDLFAKNKFLIDPVFSNLSLDNNGNVIFDLEFSVDPSFIDYQQTFKTENSSAGIF